MINPRDFKTKTIISPRKNLYPPSDQYPIAVDVGYSSVKLFSPGVCALFPAIAKKKPPSASSIGSPTPETIEYRDKDGICWYVGEVARTFMTSADKDDVLFTRDRYFNPAFKVICETALGVAMLTTQFGNAKGKHPVVQTGLPPEYNTEDSLDPEDFKRVFVGDHEFSIKIGDSEWIDYAFTLSEEDVLKIMDQPRGGLISSIMTDDGKPSADSKKILSSNLLILDIGYGTADIYNIKNGVIASDPLTFPDFGMKQVFAETCKEIDRIYHKHYTTTKLQEVLEKNKIVAANRARLRERTNNLGSDDNSGEAYTTGTVETILENASMSVCRRFLDTLQDIYDITDYAYIVLDGGTARAWKKYIKECFADLEEITTIISATKGADNLSPVFANVRGYYMYLIGKIGK